MAPSDACEFMKMAYHHRKVTGRRVPTGRRAAHHQRERLRRGHVDAVRQRRDDEARTVPEVLIIIRHDRITYSYLRPFTTETRLGIPGRISEVRVARREAHHARRRRRLPIFVLELGLPLELRGVAHFLPY